MKAYSVDLREKIVDAVLGRGMPKEEAARTFGVSVSSVSSATSRKPKRESRSLRRRRPARRGSCTHKNGMKLLEEDLQARPAVSYEQRAEFLEGLLGVRVSKSTICRMIQRMGYTRKKGAWVRAKETSS